jgi:hypothetical protein
MNNNRMMSSQTAFSAGMPYHFMMTNKGTLQQQCAMVPYTMGMGQMPMDMARQHALMMTNMMMPGTTQAFDYSFSMGMASQQFAFMCYANGNPTMSMGIHVR